MRPYLIIALVIRCQNKALIFPGLSGYPAIDKKFLRLLPTIIFLVTLVNCANRQTDEPEAKEIIDKPTPTFPALSIRNASFPLSLTDIDFQSTENVEQFNDIVHGQIGALISDIYYKDCGGDSSQTYFSIDDVYIGTIRLQDSLQSIFMVIFRHIPGGTGGKILFYDMVSKEFSDSVLDFNLHGLYDSDGVQLIPTNLKEVFQITTPEIELVDFDKDGVSDYRFTRLYHNGTANAIETTVVKGSHGKIDTLYFNQIWIGQETESP